MTCVKVSRTDFQSSSICWTTKQENSVGVFKVESVLRINTDSKNSGLIFALSSAVLAGNMYKDLDIAVNPPYLFQIAGSSKEHVIFRTYIHNAYHKKVAPNKTNDRATQKGSFNSGKFKSFKLNIVNEKASKVEDFDALYAVFKDGRDLSCKIVYEIISGDAVEIEFPVKHINFIESKKMWQMETGPILFAGRSVKGTSRKIIERLLPCFIHANSFDKVFITSDFPFNIRKVPDVSDAINYTLECKLNFLVH